MKRIIIIIYLIAHSVYSQSNQYFYTGYHVILLKNNKDISDCNSPTGFDLINVLNVINNKCKVKKNSLVLLKYFKEKNIFIIQILKPKLAKESLDFENDYIWSTTFYDEFYSCFDDCPNLYRAYEFYKYKIDSGIIKSYGKSYPE